MHFLVAAAFLFNSDAGTPPPSDCRYEPGYPHETDNPCRPAGENPIPRREVELLLRKLFASDRPATAELPGVAFCGLSIVTFGEAPNDKALACIRASLASCHEAVSGKAVLDFDTGDWYRQAIWVRPRPGGCDLVFVEDTREVRGSSARMLWANTCELHKGYVSVLDAWPDFDDYAEHCSNYGALARCPAGRDEKTGAGEGAAAVWLPQAVAVDDAVAVRGTLFGGVVGGGRNLQP